MKIQDGGYAYDFCTAYRLRTYIANPLGTSAADESESILSTEEITMETEETVSFTEYVAEVPEIKMQRRT